MNVTNEEYVYEVDNSEHCTIVDPQFEEELYEEEGNQVMNVQPINKFKPSTSFIDTKNDPNTIEKESSDCKQKEAHHCWNAEQFTAFINIMGKHKNPLNEGNKLRKDFLWKQIYKEVSAKGLPANLKECQNKWKNLIRSYRDSSKLTNKDNMKFRYYYEMCDYFKEEQSLSANRNYCNNNKNSGLNLNKPLLTNGTADLKNTKSITSPPICFNDRQFIEYTFMKSKEYAARQKRHEEEMSMRKMELDIQKQQLELMKKKAMEKTEQRSPSNKSV